MSPFSKVEMSPQRLGGGGDGLGGAVGDEHQGADSPGSGAGGSGSAYGPARGGQAVGSLGAPGETAGQALSSRRQRRARQPPPGASLQPSHRADREGSLHGTGSPALLGFRPDLAAEYLAQAHGFRYSTETLRGWMIEAGIWQAKCARRRRPHPPRERRPRLGELIQIDGSPHRWFEQRAPSCCLIAFIDDATSRVLHGRFVPAETTRAYLSGLRAHVLQHGVPAACYSDRHSIFTKHNPEDPRPTQVERAMRELGIEPIQARSPQAKGRVERL